VCYILLCLILFVCIFYINLKPVKIITTVLRDVAYSRHIILLNSCNIG